MEEVKQQCAGVQLQNEDVYMASSFQDFIQMLVRKLRGEDEDVQQVIDYVSPLRDRSASHRRVAVVTLLFVARQPKRSTT